jgi:AraC family transcriptional regulator of adaptative response / DNA-3-methyladenine glycosylase II
LEGADYTTALPFADGPLVVKMKLSATRIHVSLSRKTPEAPKVHAMAVGLLGLDQNTRAWVDLAKRNGVERLVAACPELRIHQTHSVFDGILWTIIGQQINLPFAFLLRRRLTMLRGAQMGEGLYALPTPQAVAELEPKDLLPLQYSRQKADYAAVS